MKNSSVKTTKGGLTVKSGINAAACPSPITTAAR